MTTYECWVNGCELNHSHVYELSTRCNTPESGFFKVISSYGINGNTFYRSPVYMVWWDGKQKLSCLNYLEALSEWRKYDAEYK